jgi:hypothetical protein
LCLLVFFVSFEIIDNGGPARAIRHEHLPDGGI